MAATLLTLGDTNLINIDDPAVPFRSIKRTLREADLVFANLECMLAAPPPDFSLKDEGLYAAPKVGGEALLDAGIAVVGNANNVNYGTYGINASNSRLDEMKILHCGSGKDLQTARAPVIVERGGLTFGFLQRSSIFWANNHAARADASGIAVLRGHTAYHVPIHHDDPSGKVLHDQGAKMPFNRPGVAPSVITWADFDDLDGLESEIVSLKTKVDVVVASFHWGLGDDVLQYQKDIAYRAINSGADMIVGHGVHSILPIEIYKKKPIFYGLSNCIFNEHYAGWGGLIASTSWDRGELQRATVRFLRPGPQRETTLAPLEADRLEELVKQCRALGTKTEVKHDEMIVYEKSDA